LSEFRSWRSGSQAEDRIQGASRRTTAAAALATKAMAAPGAAVLPFLVTGVQAGAGRGASARAGLPRVRIWERSPEKAEQLAAQVGAEAAPTESADVAHGLGKRRMAIAVYGSLRSLSTVLRGRDCGK
jgi:hypothetical protein